MSIFLTVFLTDGMKIFYPYQDLNPGPLFIRNCVIFRGFLCFFVRAIQPLSHARLCVNGK